MWRRVLTAIFGYDIEGARADSMQGEISASALSYQYRGVHPVPESNLLGNDGGMGFCKQPSCDLPGPTTEKYTKQRWNYTYHS